MVRRFFPRGTPFLHGRYANPSPGVRQRSWGVRCSFMDGTPVFPGGYAVESRPAPPTFMGSTPFSRPREGVGDAELSWEVRRFREARSYIGPRRGRFHGGYAVSALPWDEVGKGRCRVSGGCTTSARPCQDSRFAGRDRPSLSRRQTTKVSPVLRCESAASSPALVSFLVLLLSV
jgi:hypothetical protein